MNPSNNNLQNQLNSFANDMNTARLLFIICSFLCVVTYFKGQAMGQRLANASDQFTKQCQMMSKSYGQATDSFAEGLVRVTPNQAEILAGQQEIPIMLQQQSRELSKIVEGGIQRIEEINKNLTNSLKNPSSIEKLRKIKEETQTINNVLAKQEDEMQEICAMYANLERRQRELSEKFEKVAKEDLLQANVSRQDDLNIIQKDNSNDDSKKPIAPQQNVGPITTKQIQQKKDNQKQTVPQQLIQNIQAIQPPLQQNNKQNIPIKISNGEPQIDKTSNNQQPSKRLVQSPLASGVLDDFCAGQLNSRTQPLAQPTQQPKGDDTKRDIGDDKIEQTTNSEPQQPTTERPQKESEIERQQNPQKEPKKQIILPTLQNSNVPKRGQLRQRPQSRLGNARPQSRLADGRPQRTGTQNKQMGQSFPSEEYFGEQTQQKVDAEELMVKLQQLKELQSQLEMLQSQRDDTDDEYEMADDEFQCYEGGMGQNEVYGNGQFYDDQIYDDGTIQYDNSGNFYQQPMFVPQQRIVYVPMQQIVDPYTGQVTMRPINYMPPIRAPINQYEPIQPMTPQYFQPQKPLNRQRMPPMQQQPIPQRRVRRPNQPVQYVQQYPCYM